jgi:hypothetical protein
MYRNRNVRTGLFLILLSGAAGCDELLTPPSQAVLPEGELDVAPVSDDAPELLNTEVEFWAVRGEEREVQISYETNGSYNGKCLRFVVPPEALLRRPDGSVVEPGDSVQITIRVLDEDRFLFEFDPAGVRFDPSHPARLEVRYSWADLNGDGISSAEDFDLARDYVIWRQEEPGEAWEKIPTVRLEAEREVHAQINGFTRYALASDRSRSRQTF